MVDLTFKPGDEVKIRLALGEQKGMVLESPDSGVVLLKLDSGYNIGILNEKILDFKILRKFKEKTEKIVFVENKELKNIGLIITGGTIASKLDTRTGGVKHIVDQDEFRKYYPEIFEMVNIKKIEVPFMVASESMTSKEWIKIAEKAEEMLNKKDIEGIIITHGTDFLGYTAAALSFFLKNLNKPVVLTYSQRSIDRASSDARLNLKCAAKMAISDCAEVMVVGHATINDDYCYAFPGAKTRKMHTSRRDAFKSVNDKPISKIWPDKIEYLRSYNKRNNGVVEIDKLFDERIALIKFYPGQDPSILDYCAMKCKGVIIEASGLGHLPVSESDRSWIPIIKKLIRNGITICATTQTIFGRLEPKVYSNGRELIKAGVIFLDDMLSETAFVKLGWVLGHRGWKHKVNEKMLENFAGELNASLGREFI